MAIGDALMEEVKVLVEVGVVTGPGLLLTRMGLAYEKNQLSILKMSKKLKSIKTEDR